MTPYIVLTGNKERFHKGRVIIEYGTLKLLLKIYFLLVNHEIFLKYKLQITLFTH